MLAHEAGSPGRRAYPQFLVLWPIVSDYPQYAHAGPLLHNLISTQSKKSFP